MVADTKETVANLFDAMTEAGKAFMDAGCRAQESWVQAIGGLCQGGAGFDAMISQGEKVAKETVPFASKALRIASESMDSSFHKGMDGLKTACNAAVCVDQSDVTRPARNAWEAVSDAVQANWETFGDMSKKQAEQWSAFCGSVSKDSSTAKSNVKPSK